jgi:hypothetical protein
VTAARASSGNALAPGSTGVDRAAITRAQVALVAVSTALQLAALAFAGNSLAAGTTARQVFSTVEMVLVVALVLVAVAIVRWAADQPAPAATVARLTLASVILCTLGDFINRNYPGHSYQWDEVIRHSYLVTSIVAFAPGYALVVVANRRATAAVVPVRTAGMTVVVAAVLGLGGFVTSYDPAVAAAANVAMAVYAMVLGALAGSCLWLGRTYGWRSSAVVVAGCLLAVVADWLIATFWIHGTGYPTVEHANWIIYFASLAMIARLPFLVADGRSPARGTTPRKR